MGRNYVTGSAASPRCRWLPVRLVAPAVNCASPTCSHASQLLPLAAWLLVSSVRAARFSVDAALAYTAFVHLCAGIARRSVLPQLFRVERFRSHPLIPRNRHGNAGGLVRCPEILYRQDVRIVGAQPAVVPAKAASAGPRSCARGRPHSWRALACRRNGRRAAPQPHPRWRPYASSPPCSPSRCTTTTQERLPLVLGGDHSRGIGT